MEQNKIFSYQQNPNLCTEELLDTVSDIDCECYSFCDFEFAQCHNYPGGLLLGEQCLGTPIAGCNRATALRNKEENQNDEPSETSGDEPASAAPSAPVRQLIVFVVVFLLPFTFSA